MSVYFYYGQLSDATFDDGEAILYENQYPQSNINYLDAGVYSQINDNDSESSDTTHNIIMIYYDYGSQIATSSFALDVEGLRIQLTPSAQDIATVKFKTYGSNDELSWNLLGTKDLDSGVVASYDETLTYVYTDTYTEATYQYYKMVLEVVLSSADTLVWDIDGKINNLYIGDYLTLPSPELDRQELEHDVEVQTAYSGKRVAVEKQPQRKIWYYDYTNLTDTQKDNNIDFDLVAGQGLIPVYFENVEASTQVVDPTFVRVTNKITNITNAVESTAISQTIEGEL